MPSLLGLATFVSLIVAEGFGYAWALRPTPRTRVRAATAFAVAATLVVTAFMLS